MKKHIIALALMLCLLLTGCADAKPETETAEALRFARDNGHRVDALVMTGGCSNIPFVKTQVRQLAEEFGIAVRAGAHCAPRLHAALGTTEQGAVRFSFGWFNTEAETDAAIEAIRSIAEA